jgi:molybdate transport system substrate-binding protein
MPEIKVLSTNGVAGLWGELAPQFERTTGHKLAVTWGPTNRLKQEIGDGAAFDVAILTAEAAADLIRQGKMIGTRVDIAKSGVGLAVRAGAPKPDISTVDAFKRTMLNAKSVAYSAQGQSGVHFASLLQRLGIAEQMKPKSKVVASGPTGELAARGEAELAVQQISELLPVAGVEIVGPFPAELQLVTVFSAALGANARQKDAGEALLDFLSAQRKSPVIKAKGLEPL